jgi:LytS/YehU family sensor histidine kinase
VSIVAAIFIYYDVPYFNSPAHSSEEFIRIFSAALLIDLIVAMACLLFHLSMASKQALRIERAEKHRTEYQYERLKQQINPHFLFNSLGILDYLVQEHQTERASAYIRKLANLYRYMLNNDNKPLVKLSEELDFTMMYIDLLKERFVEGMVIDMEINQAATTRYVVPCSIQLLVENATKHNAVTASNPLTIKIMAEGEKVTVCNALIPKVSKSPSTGLGLKYMKQQYLDISGKTVDIEKSEERFCVTIPLL